MLTSYINWLALIPEHYNLLLLNMVLDVGTKWFVDANRININQLALPLLARAIKNRTLYIWLDILRSLNPEYNSINARKL